MVTSAPNIISCDFSSPLFWFCNFDEKSGQKAHLHIAASIHYRLLCITLMMEDVENRGKNLLGRYVDTETILLKFLHDGLHKQ